MNILRQLVVLSTFIYSSFMCQAATAAGAIALTPDNSNYSYTLRSSSKKTAEKEALAHCNQGMRERGESGKCQLGISSNESGYLAVAYGDNGVGLGYAGASAQAAADLAYDACAKKYRNCQSEGIKYYEDRPAPKQIANQDSCRPKTSYIRCTSSCVNGSCVVTYENGCKMRVNVSPVFNGFKNSWDYPSPSC